MKDLADLVRISDSEGGLLFENSLPDLDLPRQRSKGSTSDVSVKDWFRDNICLEGNDAIPIDNLTATIVKVYEAVASSFENVTTTARNNGALSQAEATFGIKVSAEGNTFVAKTGIEANIQVKFVWDFTE